MGCVFKVVLNVFLWNVQCQRVVAVSLVVVCWDCIGREEGVCAAVVHLGRKMSYDRLRLDV